MTSRLTLALTHDAVGRPYEPVARACSKCSLTDRQVIVRVLTKCAGCGKVHDRAPGNYQITGVLAEDGMFIPLGPA